MAVSDATRLCVESKADVDMPVVMEGNWSFTRVDCAPGLMPSRTPVVYNSPLELRTVVDQPPHCRSAMMPTFSMGICDGHGI